MSFDFKGDLSLIEINVYKLEDIVFNDLTLSEVVLFRGNSKPGS